MKKGHETLEFMKFCNQLVLNEIGEGDLIEIHIKYKIVRELPLVFKIEYL